MFGFLLLALLGEFALYRARRYRLTRTVFRGVRFDQHGSAWNYALRALAWWAAVILTLGLAYPWSQSNLERFKMRHTSYGDLPGRFEGSGFKLFLRGLPLWLLVVGPIVVGRRSDGPVDRLEHAGQDPRRRRQRRHQDADRRPADQRDDGPGRRRHRVSVLLAALLYPVFQAVLLRWWISGLRFGDVTVTSRLRIRQIYWVYLRFILMTFLFVMIGGIVGGIGIVVIGGLLRPAHATQSQRACRGAGVSIVLYVVFMISTSVIYQVVVAAGMWRLGAKSAELSGTQTLDDVRATGMPSSALGEGLADALGVGSI